MCLFEQRFWLAVLMRTTEETAIKSFSYDEIRETSKTRLVHRRYLHVVLYHTNSNMYYKYLVVVLGGEGKFVPPSHHANVYKFFATLRSYVLASFQQMTFKFKGALSSGVGGFSFTCLCQELKKTIERSIA